MASKKTPTTIPLEIIADAVSIQRDKRAKAGLPVTVGADEKRTVSYSLKTGRPVTPSFAEKNPNYVRTFTFVGPIRLEINRISESQLLPATLEKALHAEMLQKRAEEIRSNLALLLQPVDYHFSLKTGRPVKQARSTGTVTFTLRRGMGVPKTQARAEELKELQDVFDSKAAAAKAGGKVVTKGKPGVAMNANAELTKHATKKPAVKKTKPNAELLKHAAPKVDTKKLSENVMNALFKPAAEKSVKKKTIPFARPTPAKSAKR